MAKIKVPKSKRYKRIRAVALLNVLLLVFNIFSFFWISGLVVGQSLAAEIGVCLVVCEQGENCNNLTEQECEDLVNPPAPEEEEEEQAEEEETTVVPGTGPQFSPLSTPEGLITPEQIKNYLVPTEVTTPIYNRIEKVYSPELSPITVTADQRLVIPAASASTYLTFGGKTNIKNAIIIITLTSPEYFYATVYANNNGNWSWTVPQILLPGFHNLTVLAMSPSNAQIREVYTLEFYIEAPKPTDTEIVGPIPAEPSELPEILPPIELPPIEITKDIYTLNLEVVAEGETIQPGSEISLVTDITSFDPTTQKDVNLEFTIRDQNGKLIFEDLDIVSIKDSASVIKRLSLLKTIKPGDYLATAKLTKDGVTYLNSVSFIIQEAEKEAFVLLPGRIIIPQDEAQRGLFISFSFLSLLLIFFLILLWREYQKAKHEIQITGQDLLQSGQVG